MALRAPLPGAKITQPFDGHDPHESPRYHDEYRGYPLACLPTGGKFPGCDPIPAPHYHGAIDFGAPEGAPIGNCERGKVIEFGKARDGNLYVRVQIRPGTVLGYSHLSRFVRGIRVGQVIPKGGIVGYVGHTGAATGPHLHLTLKITEKAPDHVTRVYLYDPTLFMLNSGSSTYPYLANDHRIQPAY